MARAFAKPFYNSTAWQKTSRAYMESQHWLCERCGGVASICHHRQWLDPANITDPSVALSWENLECLCQDCHNKEHMSKDSVYMMNDGQIVGMKENAEMKAFREAQAAIDAL